MVGPVSAGGRYSGLRLSHYSRDPHVIPRSVDPGAAARRHRYDKPTGLWVSVDGPDDWPSWCREEDFRDVDAQFHHRVTLVPSARVLLLTGYDEILAFSRTYYSGDPRRVYWGLEWTRVMGDYQGIIIAPYSWEARLSQDTSWYYSWDCASGCIWDAGAIAAVDLVLEEDGSYPDRERDTPEKLLPGRS